MADNRQPIHIQGSVTTADIQAAIAAVGHGAQVTITAGGDLTIQQIVPPDFTRTANPPALTAYLQQFYEEIDRQLQQTTRIFIASPATDDPAAVRPAYTFQPCFRRSPVASGQPTHPKTAPAEPHTFDSFAAAFEHHNQRLLLLGDPGMGKTTALLHFARSAAARRLKDSTAPIPILQSIYTWDHKAPLAQWANPPNLPLDNQPLLYLLDGLDELGGSRPIDPKDPGGEQFDPRADFVRAAEHLPAQAALVISSRIKDYTEIGEQLTLPGAATLQPLADEQVKRYLEAHEQPDLWQAIRQDDSLLELARTPLLLALIAIGFAGKQAELTGITRNDVFDHYIHARFQHELSRLPEGESLPFDEATTRELLGKIAARMWRSLSFSKVALPLDAISNLVRHTRKLANFGQHMHLLQQLPGDHIQFIHLALRDYCAIPGLLAALSDQSWGVRRSAALALGRTSDPAAISGLLAALSDQRWGVRSNAARALGRIGDSAAIPGLLVALNDQDSWVRSNAARALGQIGDPTPIPSLLKALSDQDSSVRRYTTEALSQIGAPVVPGLLKALSGQNSDVRFYAARALGQIGDPVAILGLIEHLNDTETGWWGGKRVCDAAAYALQQIGTPEALAAVEQWQREQHGS